MKMETIERTKTMVRKKFRSIRRFSQVSEIPEEKLRSFFAGYLSQEAATEMRARIQEKVRKMKTVPQDPGRISPQERETIRQIIVVRFKTITAFSTDHPEFTKDFLSQVIKGRKQIKTQRVKDLIRLLKKYHPKMGKLM